MILEFLYKYNVKFFAKKNLLICFLFVSILLGLHLVVDQHPSNSTEESLSETISPLFSFRIFFQVKFS